MQTIPFATSTQTIPPVTSVQTIPPVTSVQTIPSATSVQTIPSAVPLGCYITIYTTEVLIGLFYHYQFMQKKFSLGSFITVSLCKRGFHLVLLSLSVYAKEVFTWLFYHYLYKIRFDLVVLTLLYSGSTLLFCHHGYNRCALLLCHHGYNRPTLLLCHHGYNR